MQMSSVSTYMNEILPNAGSSFWDVYDASGYCVVSLGEMWDFLYSYITQVSIVLVCLCVSVWVCVCVGRCVAGDWRRASFYGVTFGPWPSAYKHIQMPNIFSTHTHRTFYSFLVPTFVPSHPFHFFHFSDSTPSSCICFSSFLLSLCFSASTSPFPLLLPLFLIVLHPFLFHFVFIPFIFLLYVNLSVFLSLSSALS